jgi:integrase
MFMLDGAPVRGKRADGNTFDPVRRFGTSPSRHRVLLHQIFPTVVAASSTATPIVEYGLWPAQIAAGVVDADGAAKYKGLHALRHFYASWCINRRVDGGLELPLKVVQARLGHASIQMTADVYGHLFPRGDDGAEMAAAERALLEQGNTRILETAI